MHNSGSHAISQKQNKRQILDKEILKKPVLILGWTIATRHMIVEFAQARVSNEFLSNQIYIVVDGNIDPADVYKELKQYITSEVAKPSGKDEVWERYTQQQNTYFTEGMPLSIDRLELCPKSNAQASPILTIYCRKDDYTNIATIEEELKEAGRVVIVADSGDDSIAIGHEFRDRDARTVFTALAIHNFFRYQSQEKKNKRQRRVPAKNTERKNQLRSIDQQGPLVVVEITNRDNAVVFDDTEIEVVLRNDISGAALATACRHPKLVDVPTGLLTILDGHRLSLVTEELRQVLWEEPILERNNWTFQDAGKFYSDRGAIVIGYDVSGVKAKENPDSWTPFTYNLPIPKEATLIIMSDRTKPQ